MGRRNGSEGKWFVTRVYPAYPNRTQERELLRQLDVARGVYNHFAETCIHCLIDGTHVPDPMEMNREFTLMRADDCLLRSVNSYTLRDHQPGLAGCRKMREKISNRRGAPCAPH